MKHKSVYTKNMVSKDADGKQKIKTVELTRDAINTRLKKNEKVKCQVHYEDGKGRSTAKQDIILKSNKNSEGYIVSENVKGETIGTLTMNSFLKGNDTRLILGMNASPKADLFIQKRLQAPTKEQAMNGLKILRDYLNSLNL